MALVIYTKIRELQIQEKEIYEFGNWLRSYANEKLWDDDEYGEEYETVTDAPINDEGELMEYPWEDFSYIIVPDSNDEISEALEISQMLGVTLRYDIQDMGRVFFVVR